MSVPIRDAAGRRHQPAAVPARIVSLVPSITELLFALGLGGQVVGRTTFCIHPRDGVARVPRVGGTKTPRLDRIAALEPTHAVLNVDENRIEDAEALQALGVEVIATHPQGPRDNVELYRLLGRLFHREQQAERLAARFLDALHALVEAAARRPRRRVLYLIWREPWMTVCADTYIARTLAEAGLDVWAPHDAARYPRLDPAAVPWQRLDAVLLSSEPYPFKSRHAAEVRAASARDELPVAFIDGEMTSWYGSRAIAGCEYLRAFCIEPAGE